MVKVDRNFFGNFSLSFFPSSVSLAWSRLVKMGNSSSKQPPQEEQQDTATAPSSDSNAQLDQLEPQSEHTMQQDEVEQSVATPAATGDAIIQTETSQHSPIPSSSTSLPPSSTTTTDNQDTFKIPSLPSHSTAPLSPNSSSLKALPADIEHILSLGANEDQLRKAAKEGGQGAVDQVVRELREKYAKDGGGELSQVEKEMKDKGIVRVEESVTVVEQEDKMDQG